MINLAYILSLPRSGSTVLSALLDKFHGVVAPPESCFPQVLGVTPPRERCDPHWVAALYLAATLTPTPLDIEDASLCVTEDDTETLGNLGRMIASKLGRDPSEVKAVVWKTPRIVGMNDGPLATNGRFLVLRRHPQNVFESNFRVGFGESNRKPLRFAIFRESYENAFARLPANRVMEVAYDDLPDIMPDLLKFIGIDNSIPWEDHRPSLQLAADHCAWLSEVTGEFQNRDLEKRARLSSEQVSKLEWALNIARPLRPLLGPLRTNYDRKSLAWVRNKACDIMKETGHRLPK